MIAGRRVRVASRLFGLGVVLGCRSAVGLASSRAFGGRGLGGVGSVAGRVGGGTTGASAVSSGVDSSAGRLHAGHDRGRRGRDLDRGRVRLGWDDRVEVVLGRGRTGRGRVGHDRPGERGRDRTRLRARVGLRFRDRRGRRG